MKKNHGVIKFACGLCVMILFISTGSLAQNTAKVDNGYYIIYPEKIHSQVISLQQICSSYYFVFRKEDIVPTGTVNFVVAKKIGGSKK